MFIVIFAIVVSAIAYYLYHELHEKRKNLPPGPTPWPIVGNILQLDQSQVEKTLAQWGKQYGPVFTIWIPVPWVIVNDYELMKETFLKQGDIFTGRPETFIMSEFAKGNYGLVFSKDELWREQRRFSLHVMRDFGIGRNVLEPKILEQARELVSILHQSNGPMQLKTVFGFAVGNIINILIFGYSWKFGDPEMIKFRETLDTFLNLATKPSILLLELYPWIRFLEPPFNIGFQDLKAADEKFKAFFCEEIRKHKETIDENELPRDYADAYLIEMNKRIKAGNQGYFTEWQMMAALGDMWSAGMETTVTTLRFAIIYLLNYPDVQKKLHDELDNIIGRERELSMNDQRILPYFCATIQEVQRLANILPINLQHTVTEDVLIAGYKIPKDTIVVAQTPSVHLNETLFPDPERFSPERHIDKDGRFVKSEYILPFSIGKRACMGESLARMELFLMLGTLLQHCEFQPVDGKTPPPNKVMSGIVRSPVTYECIVVPRT